MKIELKIDGNEVLSGNYPSCEIQLLQDLARIIHNRTVRLIKNNSLDGDVYNSKLYGKPDSTESED